MRTLAVVVCAVSFLTVADAQAEWEWPWDSTDEPAAAPEGLEDGRYVSRRRLEGRVPAHGTSEFELDVTPYSASYLPAARGDLAKEADCSFYDEIQNGFLEGACDLFNDMVKENANLSAAEKFDTSGVNVTGRNPGLLADYRRRGHRPDAESWEGFCHNWAPASIDPLAGLMTDMDVVFGEVPFGVGDLRELVTYTYPSPNSIFFGTRNYGDKPEDKNMTAVDVHTIFTEYVGPGKPGVVFDIDPGTQVWNQPYFKYELNATDASADDQLKGAVPNGGRALHVKMTAHYAVEGEYAYRGDVITRTSRWSYYLVLDDEDKIVGGKWDDKARNSDIPDFAWVPDRTATNKWFEHLDEIAKDGVPVKAVEEFCTSVAQATSDGEIDEQERAHLKELARNLAPVTDPDRLHAYLRDSAASSGIDYSELSTILVA